MGYAADARRRTMGALDRELQVRVYSPDRDGQGEVPADPPVVDVAVWGRLLEQGSALVLEEGGTRSDPSSTWVIRYDARFVGTLGDLYLVEPGSSTERTVASMDVIGRGRWMVLVLP